MVLTSNDVLEEFKNHHTPQNHQDVFNSDVSYNTYTTANLTSPLLSKKATQNLLSGGGRKIVSKDKVIIDIYANLPLLDGNVYTIKDIKAPSQKYEAMLYDTIGIKPPIKLSLKRDGDGLYKVQYSTDNVSTAKSLNAIDIVHVENGNNKVILQGTFT